MSVPEQIDAILKGIAKVQRAIPPPQGSSKATALDEPTPNVGSFPYWLNLVERMPIEARGMGHTSRFSRFFITLNLLFSPAADAKYLYRERYGWVQPVLDFFDADPRLDNTCVEASITQVQFEPPLDWNGVDYVALTFLLEVLPHDQA